MKLNETVKSNAPFSYLSISLGFAPQVEQAIVAFNRLLEFLCPDENDPVCLLAGGLFRTMLVMDHTHPIHKNTNFKDVDVFFYSWEIYEQATNVIKCLPDWVVEDNPQSPSMETRITVLYRGEIPFDLVTYPEIVGTDDKLSPYDILSNFDIDICRVGIELPFRSDARCNFHYIPPAEGIVKYNSDPRIANVVHFNTPASTIERVEKYEQRGYRFPDYQKELLVDLVKNS